MIGERIQAYMRLFDPSSDEKEREATEMELVKELELFTTMSATWYCFHV